MPKAHQPGKPAGSKGPGSASGTAKGTSKGAATKAGAVKRTGKGKATGAGGGVSPQDNDKPPQN